MQDPDLVGRGNLLSLFAFVGGKISRTNPHKQPEKKIGFHV
jgi:hypothetical protein